MPPQPGTLPIAAAPSIVTWILTAAAYLALAAGGQAHGQDWTIQSAKGTALKLSGDQWEEVVIGETVVDGGIYRTMRGARIVLEGEGALVSLGSRTAISIDLLAEGASVLQYAGVVTVATHGSGSGPMRVKNAALTASATGTTFTVFFDGAAARVEVDSGTVLVAEATTGAQLTVGAGDAISTSAAAGGNPEAAADAGGAGGNGNGNISGNGGGGGSSGDGNANGGNSGSGNNNAGGDGNGSGNGNGNGNGGGNGNSNSNAGGNGNGNFGGSGNGNSNAGGNGNGNGNGNGT